MKSKNEDILMENNQNPEVNTTLINANKSSRELVKFQHVLLICFGINPIMVQ